MAYLIKKFILLIRKIMIFLFILFSFVIVFAIYKYFYNISKRDFRVENEKRYLENISSSKTLGELPNVIVIMADDLGYGDLSSYGSTLIDTPNIDLLAQNGSKMMNFYSSSSVCSPSRAGLLTGRYPLRTLTPNVFYPNNSGANFMNKVIDKYYFGVEGIPKDEILLPEVLKEVGYHTALIGKWHLGDHGEYLPRNNGFDYFYGSHYSNNMKPYKIYENEKIVMDDEVDQIKLTKNFTEKIVDYIEENKEERFFIYYSQPFPHIPLNRSIDFVGVSEAGKYGDVVEEIDWSVGEIINSLENNNIDNNTLVIFTSDNGPNLEGSVNSLRGRKGLTFEGGQKVPFIVYWPNHIYPETEIDAMSMNIDVFPTIINLIGVNIPTDRIIDGKDIMPLLKGESTVSPHKYLFYIKGKKIQAVRGDKFKYHRDQSGDNSSLLKKSKSEFLFDLEIDSMESYNLIEVYPKKAQNMKEVIYNFEKSLKANLRGWIE